ncbi:MAG: methyltransferase domain-containing protein [SAR324 cluster bacterium]|nr:methyltransferase domain-containing protein [SAR324 cluster bacterium]
MTTDWTDDYFQGLALEAWENENSPEKTRADADFLLDALDAGLGTGPARLLDVPCGDGRLALELARRGYKVTAVDRDAAQLATAKNMASREKAARQEKLSIQWRRADMRRLRFRGGFDGAFCFGNSFGYFGPDGTAAFLAGMGRALRPGGRLVIDTQVAAESLLPTLEHRIWQQAGDIAVLAEYAYHPAESRLDSTFTFIKGQRREVRTASHWVFTIGEIGRMLAASGVRILHLYADTDGSPFEMGAPRVLLVGGKS